MGGGYVSNAGQFLLSTLFGLYIVAVMLRFLLQWVRADFYNPVSQFLVKVTNPPLRPLRRLIPGWRGLDLASVVLLLALQALEIVLLTWMDPRALSLPAPAGLVVLSLAKLLSLLLSVYFFSILIEVILSWVNPGTYNPAAYLLHQINEPVMRPARSILPPMGGLDLSPIVVLIALQLVRFLVVDPLTDFGFRLAY